MVLVRLINKSDKILFERCIDAPLESIPFAKIIDVLNFLYKIPHDTLFVICDLDNIDLSIKMKNK